MIPDAAPPVAGSPGSADPGAALSEGETAAHIRGSALFLVGRILDLGLDFTAHVLIVRYLAKSEYGAFAYALALVSLGATVAVFGLDKSMSRFLAMYQEQRRYGPLFGAIVVALATILILGLGTVIAVHTVAAFFPAALTDDPRALFFLGALIFLSPIQALDSMVVRFFPVFASPRSFFVRRYLLGPLVHLAIVVVLIAGSAESTLFAIGFVGAGLINLAISAVMLLRILTSEPLSLHFRRSELEWPVREILGYSVPLLASDVVLVLRGALVVVLLEFFQNTTDVADFRAVLPVARLNMVVFQTFTFMFMPLAARLFVREDREGLQDAFWRSSAWVTLISLPGFLLSFALAQPLVDAMFGPSYHDSAPILMVLSLGFFVTAVFGFGGLVLRTIGNVRYMFGVDALTAVASFVGYVLVIPAFGALGAAVVLSATLVAQALLYQLGLRLFAGIQLFDRRYLGFFSSVVLASAALLVIQLVADPPLAVGLALATAVSVAVLALNRHTLDLLRMFPELKRVPLIRRLVGN